MKSSKLSFITSVILLSIAALPSFARPKAVDICIADANGLCEELYSPPTVYATGYDNDNIGLPLNSPWRKIAKVWTNGVATPLTDGTYEAEGFSIFVDNLDQVYVAGYERSGNVYNAYNRYTVAKVWINGNPISLTDGTKSGVARSVSVESGHVYVAGRDGNMAKIWADGTELYSLSDAFFNAVFAIGSDVYYCGEKVVPNLPSPYNVRATIWKNGIEILQQPAVNSDKNTYCNSIFVRGFAVYAAGVSQQSTYVNKATLWTNGAATYLTPAGVQPNGTTAAAATSVYVKNANVYVAGYSNENYIRRAKLWVNGVATNLSARNNLAWAFSVFVDDNFNVYIGGQEQNQNASNQPNVGMIWKNGAVNYSTNTYYQHSINSVYVK